MGCQGVCIYIIYICINNIYVYCLYNVYKYIYNIKTNLVERKMTGEIFNFQRYYLYFSIYILIYIKNINIYILILDYLLLC